MVDRASYNSDSIEEWSDKDTTEFLKFTAKLFDANDKLLIFTDEDWDDNWIRLEKCQSPPDDEDIPF